MPKHNRENAKRTLAKIRKIKGLENAEYIACTEPGFRWALRIDEVTVLCAQTLAGLRKICENVKDQMQKQNL